jgi:hypothetical protein
MMEIDINKLNKALDTIERENERKFQEKNNIDIAKEEAKELEKNTKSLSLQLFSDKGNRKFLNLYMNILKINLNKTPADCWEVYYMEGIRRALDIFESLLHPKIKIKLIQDEDNEE